MLAGELLRLCASHPRLTPRWLATREPLALAGAHPHLAELGSGMEIESVLDAVASLAHSNEQVVAFFAMPHGESSKIWPRLRATLASAASRVCVVDLAADYRIASADVYEKTYNERHPDPSEVGRFCYALPELAAEPLQGKSRLAAPGCFATALQLAAVPAARAGILDTNRPWIFNGVTGSSGSGNQLRANTHHPFREGNLYAYAAQGHRHEVELLQAIANNPGRADVHFIAHSGPFVRGIHMTAALPLVKNTTVEDARSIFQNCYKNAPFARVLASGLPELRHVIGSNRADIAVSVRGGVLSVFVVIDNLIKGAVGQALQALNLSMGWPETLGLPRAGMGVV